MRVKGLMSEVFTFVDASHLVSKAALWEERDMLIKHRHLVENAFLHLKRWRGIATRYAKHTTSFLAAVQIRCIAIWAEII